MAAHKLQNVIDSPRAALVFELLHRDLINVALAQVVERCAHYEKLDTTTAKKGSRRFGIELTAPDGTKLGTVRVTPQLLATAFSETFRSVRSGMRCTSQHDFLFYLHGTNIVDSDKKRYTLAVDGNRFILKVSGLPLLEAAQKKAPAKPGVVPFPVISRNDTGDLTPSTKRAFRDLWNSLLDEAKEPLATLSENCMLKTPRYVANVTRVEVGFAQGRDKRQFCLAYVAKGATNNELRSMGKLFPVTAKGIADAMHSLRVRCPMPTGNVAAKPTKADKKADKKAEPKKADKKPATKKPEPKKAPKPAAKKQAPKAEPNAAPAPAQAPVADAPATNA